MYAPAMPAAERAAAASRHAEARLGGILGGVDGLEAPERPRNPGRDGGELLRLHAASHRDARHRQRAATGMPPADTAGAEDPVAEILDDALEIRRLPAPRQRSAAHGCAETILEYPLRLPELAPHARCVELVHEGVRERMAADLHAGRRHLPELRPADVPGRPTSDGTTKNVARMPSSRSAGNASW